MEIQMPGKLTILADKYITYLKRTFFRLGMKIKGNNRPSNYPYVSGDSFRALADHIYDWTEKLDPKSVKKGDIVFSNNDILLEFLQKIHPQIDNPYVLICHNGDTPVDQKIVDLIDDKIIKFYAQDVTHGHPKIVPIPIAIENVHFYMNGIPSVFNKLKRQIARHPPVRKNKIFFRFNPDTNPTERIPAMEYFSKHPLMETLRERVSPKLHLKLLGTYKFVASPPGHAIESCRTWEALELKTVPIVKDFVAMRYFVSLGLPIWIVKDWHELDNFTEESLATKYDEHMKTANWKPLHMDFWIKQIKADQEIAKKS